MREGIRACHGPVEKCVVVPYGVDTLRLKDHSESQNKKGTISCKKHNGRRALRVLTVGSVGLRKGAPAVYEAAKAMQGRAQFRWVGCVELLLAAAERMRTHIELTGGVPRSEVQTHFAWADVFFLP